MSGKMKFRGMEYESCKESAEYLLERTKYRPKIGIICGTGLAGLGDLVEDFDVFLYKDIPHFPTSTATSHKSRCLFGKLSGVEVFVMQGRFHLYEGYDIGQCAMPVRVMKLLGVTKLLLSNAAGGINPDFNVGDIMMIKDHVNLVGFVGFNPLAGPQDPRFGPRFFAMNNVYCPKWREKMRLVAQKHGCKGFIREGVYTMLAGPNFETPAELKMLKTCGIDAVGMSTVHEALTAHQCDMKVFAISLITNICVLDDTSEDMPNIEEVIDAGKLRENQLRLIVKDFIVEISNDDGN